MNFVEAVTLLFQGKRIRRKSWTTFPTSHIVIEKFDGVTDWVLHYDNIKTPCSADAWFGTDDIMAKDWEILE